MSLTRFRCANSLKVVAPKSTVIKLSTVASSCWCSLFVRRYSIGAVPRLVAPVAPVRFRVVARSRLAQLVERKTLNLVVVGSSPTVGELAPVAQLAARRSHNPKVASSILAGSNSTFPR